MGILALAEWKTYPGLGTFGPALPLNTDRLVNRGIFALLRDRENSLKLVMHRIYTLLIGFLLGSAAGYFAGRLGDAKPPPLETQDRQEEVHGWTYRAKMQGSSLMIETQEIEHLRQVYQLVREKGVSIEPMLTTLSDTDLSAILDALKEFDGLKPILNIKILGPTKVEVKTGEVRGLLDGDGSIYEVEQLDGKWTAEETGVWVS